jgi:hypothetical protein
MAHISQSGPDSGLGSQGKVFKKFGIVPSSLGSGTLALGAVPLAAGPLPSEEGTVKNKSGLLPESHDQNLALTVLYVPYSLVHAEQGPRVGRRPPRCRFASP